MRRREGELTKMLRSAENMQDAHVWHGRCGSQLTVVLSSWYVHGGWPHDTGGLSPWYVHGGWPHDTGGLSPRYYVAVGHMIQVACHLDITWRLATWYRWLISPRYYVAVGHIIQVAYHLDMYMIVGHMVKVAYLTDITWWLATWYRWLIT